MQKAISSLRRKMYTRGKRMIALPISFYLPFSYICTGISATAIAVLAQAWRFATFSDMEFLITLIKYTFLVAVAVGFVAIVFKIIVSFCGWIVSLLGVPDKIKLERVNNHKFVEIKIDNGEEEVFAGEFKILRINDDKLNTPLTMGVFRGKHMDSKIIIPKGESISVVIGLFDDDLGYAYFLDAYGQQKVLPPQTRIYTKLSGNLENEDEIVKESQWFINYKDYDDGKGLSLSNLIEITNQKLGVGSINLITLMTAIKKKIMRQSKRKSS